MRAVVIRKFGDPDMANAIADAMVPTSNELEVVRAQMQQMRAQEASLGVRVVRDRDYWRTKCAEAEYLYGDHERKPGKIATALLVGWAMLWQAIADSWWWVK